MSEARKLVVMKDSWETMTITIFTRIVNGKPRVWDFKMSTTQDEAKREELKPEEVCCGDVTGKPMADVAAASKFFVLHKNKEGEVTHIQEIKFYGID